MSTEVVIWIIFAVVTLLAWGYTKYRASRVEKNNTNTDLSNDIPSISIQQPFVNEGVGMELITFLYSSRDLRRELNEAYDAISSDFYVQLCDFDIEHVVEFNFKREGFSSKEHSTLELMKIMKLIGTYEADDQREADFAGEIGTAAKVALELRVTGFRRGSGVNHDKYHELTQFLREEFQEWMYTSPF